MIGAVCTTDGQEEDAQEFPQLPPAKIVQDDAEIKIQEIGEIAPSLLINRNVQLWEKRPGTYNDGPIHIYKKCSPVGFK